jgi:hypothetical protein
MSKIQERLNELRPYVVGIRYLQGIQLVDAVLKEGWAVPESQIIQRERVDGDENYYMFFSNNEDIDIDDLLDFVQEIINLNIEREKKYELLKSKVTELQKIFKENTLAKLQKLKFTFNEPDIIPSLIDMDNIKADIDINEEPISIEPKIEEPKVQVNKQTVKTNKNGKTHTINKVNDIELPPKPGEKIELVEFNEPNVICKCGPNEICPICEEEKVA